MRATAGREEEERAWRNEPDGALSRLKKWVGVRDLPGSAVISQMPEPSGCRCHECLAVDRRNLRIYLWQLQDALEDTVEYNRFIEEEIDRASRFLMEAREPAWLPIPCTRGPVDGNGGKDVEVIDLLSSSAGDDDDDVDDDNDDDDADDSNDGNDDGGWIDMTEEDEDRLSEVGEDSRTEDHDDPGNRDPDWTYTGQGEDRRRSHDFSEYGGTIEEVISESVREWMRYFQDRKDWSDVSNDD